MEKTVVISLGGSIIVPDSIDINFLKDFKKTIEKFIKKGYKFAIFCGGGSIARKYQTAASSLTKLNNFELDLLGIEATKLNANFVKSLFGNKAEKEIVTNPTKKINFKKNVLVAAGWKPGWSTDYDAVLLAKQLKVDIIINMSNIDYVYDKDPRKFKSAKKIINIPWKEFRNMVGSTWKAGMNAPFDPIAAKQAEKQKAIVVVTGKNLKNLENIILGNNFKGSVLG